MEDNNLMSMDLKQVRDNLIRQQALNKQALETRNLKINKIKSLLETISEEDLDLAERQGIYLRNLRNIDYDRMRTDNEYTQTLKKEIETLLITLKKNLQELQND